MIHRSSSRMSPAISSEQRLPTYNPISGAARREKRFLRAAENAVHVIPVVLFLCAFLLWFFSFSELKS